MKLIFESQTCRRCGGSGRMPFSAYAGVCFKCNGVGNVVTRAGSSARKLYQELLDAACPRKQAWEVEIGERVSYGTNAASGWFTVLNKGFDSRTGGVVNGRCEGSAVLESAKCTHFVNPAATVMVYPGAAAHRDVMQQVAQRRKGATLVDDSAAVA